MWKVQLRLGNFDLDLYGNETISFTKQINDFEEIDTVYGDYSQSFTIPATPNNIKAFDYYYKDDYVSDFDPALKNEAQLLINRVLYSTGVITLQSIGMKGNEPSFFKVQFFSDTVNLKEVLNNRKMNDLDFSAFNHNNLQGTIGPLLDGSSGFDSTGSIIADTTGASTVARYGMGSVENAWQWATSGFSGKGKRNISQGSHTANNTTAGIRNTEVRPFFKISYLLDKVFDEAGFDYNVDFSADTAFSNAYLWFSNTGQDKNNTTDVLFKYSTGKTIVYPFSKSTTGGASETAATLRDFRVKNQDTPASYIPSAGWYVIPANGNYDIQLDTGSLSAGQNAGSVGNFVAPSLSVQLQKSTDGGATFSDVSTPKVFSSTTNVNTWSTTPFNSNDIFRFIVEDIKYLLVGAKYQFKADANVQITSAPTYTSTKNVISDFAPDLSQEAFIKGILKAFNAVIYFDQANERFEIVNRDTWYDSGNVFDFTEYIDKDSYTIKPNAQIKEFDFGFEDAEDFVANEFTLRVGRSYGDTRYDVGSYFGSVYDVDFPFTCAYGTEVVTSDANGTITFQSDIVANMMVDDAFGRVKSGYRIMYFSGQTSLLATWALREDNTPTNVYTSTNYAKFDAIDFNNEIAFTFNSEYGFDGVLYETNLLTAYYANYVNRLYNKDVRVIEITAYIPYSIMRTIQMNDKIVIGARPYLLNSLDIDLTTGKTKMKIINFIEDV